MHCFASLIYYCESYVFLVWLFLSCCTVQLFISDEEAQAEDDPSNSESAIDTIRPASLPHIGTSALLLLA